MPALRAPAFSETQAEAEKASKQERALGTTRSCSFGQVSRVGIDAASMEGEAGSGAAMLGVEASFGEGKHRLPMRQGQ